MKESVVKDLRERLSKLPLGTTAGNHTEQAARDGLSPAETFRALQAHDTAIDRLLTDAVHRRRDVQGLLDVTTTLQARDAALFDDEGRLRIRERPPVASAEPDPGWHAILSAIAHGAWLMLHLATLGALAFLLLRDFR